VNLYRDERIGVICQVLILLPTCHLAKILLCCTSTKECAMHCHREASNQETNEVDSPVGQS
jgi:hypothetical protein